MSDYYYRNRKELFKKAYDKYYNKGGKERAKKYYQANKEQIKKKERMKYQYKPEDEKEVIEERQRSLKRHYRMKKK